MTRFLRFYHLVVLTFAILPCGTVYGDLLTFETTPTGATPIDDEPLTTSYAIPGGTVRFFFDANANNLYDSGIDTDPVFEQKGPDGTNGFEGPPGQDRARIGFESRLGEFYLRHPNVDLTLVQPFIVDYDTSVVIKELSGEIWDIDGNDNLGTEQWRIDVLTASGGVLGSRDSPVGMFGGPNSLNGMPWIFQFTDLPIGVDKLRITFIGTKTERLGLAFNNFSPDVALPEPGSAVLVTIGGLLAFSRRRTMHRGAGGRNRTDTPNGSAF
jgi:hypothetical protein